VTNHTESVQALQRNKFGGNWTLIKLEALEKYLSAFNRALSKQSFTRIYIDAFAGTGRCDISLGDETKIIDGSALRALNVTPAFHNFYFIERQSKKLLELKALQEQHADKLIEIIPGDANVELKALCKRYLWKGERAVLFLDPFGMQVEWTTLQAIADTRAIDVWYLFPYAALYRQAAKRADALDEDKIKSLTRILGTDEWRQVFYRPNPQLDFFGNDCGDIRDTNPTQMLEFVSTRLKGLFPDVTKPKVLYQKADSQKNSGAPLFALYFAASNPNPKAYNLAIKIAGDILKTL